MFKNNARNEWLSTVLRTRKLPSTAYFHWKKRTCVFPSWQVGVQGVVPCWWGSEGSAEKLCVLVNCWCNVLHVIHFASSVNMCILTIFVSKHSQVQMTNIHAEAQHRKGSCFSARFFLGHQWLEWRCQYPASVFLSFQMSWGEIRGFMQLRKKLICIVFFVCQLKKYRASPGKLHAMKKFHLAWTYLYLVKNITIY